MLTGLDTQDRKRQARQQHQPTPCDTCPGPSPGRPAHAHTGLPLKRGYPVLPRMLKTCPTGGPRCSRPQQQQQRRRRHCRTEGVGVQEVQEGRWESRDKSCAQCCSHWIKCRTHTCLAVLYAVCCCYCKHANQRTRQHTLLSCSPSPSAAHLRTVSVGASLACRRAAYATHSSVL